MKGSCRGRTTSRVEADGILEHSSCRHYYLSKIEPLVRDGHEVTYRGLHPTVFADADGIETLSTPRLSLPKHHHAIQIDQLFRRRWRTLHPTLPPLLCRWPLLSLFGLLRLRLWRVHVFASVAANILVVVRCMRTLGRSGRSRGRDGGAWCCRW